MRKDLYFKSRDELEMVLENLPNIGMGAEASCYRLDPYHVIKYFDGPLYMDIGELGRKLGFSVDSSAEITAFENSDFSPYNDRTKEEIEALVGLENPPYVFATGIVYIHNKIVALTIPFCKGKNVSDLDLSTCTLTNLIKGIRKVEIGTEKLSQKKLIRTDFGIENMLFDRDHFFIIDPLEYHFSEQSEQEIEKKNITNFSVNLFDSLLPKEGILSEFIDQFNQKYEFDKGTSPSHYLQTLKIALSTICSQSVRTLDQAEKILKRKGF